MKCRRLIGFAGDGTPKICDGELKFNESWKPGHGMAPQLRRFDCPKCGQDFYLLINPELPMELIKKGVHNGTA